MIEREVVVKGLRIKYKAAGSGRPLLILHGWRSNSYRWQKVIDNLFQPNNNVIVIIPDLPGFGESEEPKSPWSADDYVEWIKEFSSIVPELKNDFYLVGHSFGGMLASKFSLKYTQKVKKLLLVSASCIRLKTPSKKLAYNISRLVKIFYFFPYYELFRKFVYKYIIKRSDYLHVSGIMKDIYLKVIPEDLSYKLPFLKVPTVIIWGPKDDLTPIEHAHIIHKKISHSKLVIIPEADHYLNIKMPEILAQKILENING